MDNPEPLSYGWAAIFGAVQGLTEFLPVSSSGHLALAQHWGRGQTENMAFDVLLHLATLGVVGLTYGRTWLAWWRERRAVFFYAAAATVPAGAAGWLLHHRVEQFREYPAAIGACFLVTAAALFLSERLAARTRTVEALGWRRALAVGFCQAAALLPGISRSGFTLSGGLACGLSREDALAFSFTLAVPVMGGAGLLEGMKAVRHPGSFSALPAAGPCAAGCLAAFAAGWAALWALKRISLSGRLWVFSVYLALLGLACIVF